MSLLLLSPAYAASCSQPQVNQTLIQEKIIKQLGWIQTNENRCGGYYLEPPITYPANLLNNNLVQITSNQLLFAQHGTSVSQGQVTITRYGQQINANKAFLYRDPKTGKLKAIELIDEVTLREPNSLIVANRGQYNLETKGKSLHDILYRTTIYSNPQNKPVMPTNQELQLARKVYQLSAWGQAKDFIQEQPEIYEFDQASYSTCSPTDTTWQVKASHIELNKETGRGTATHARVLFKGIPIFYSPYLNFPIDSRRKTGFLWPTIGYSNKYGPYLMTPFYWNLAPNYDTTITPGFLGKRGFRLSDIFRYLTPGTKGKINFDILPDDKEFASFKDAMEDEFGSSTDPIKQGELRRLENSSKTRKAFSWQNDTRFNEHWSSDVDFTYVSDDYYLKDISNNFSQVTQNQLLQQAELNYEGQNWNFIGRIQGYQTLHPVDESVIFRNQYTRLPQLVLNGDYPNSPGGFDYFVDNELTHFTIQKNPGTDMIQPIGNRLNIQPGISRPINYPWLTVTPRLQLAMTQYQLTQVRDSNPSNPNRVLPIFDLNSAFYFDRNIRFLNRYFRQTLEPQLYYTYIPFKDQRQIPVFDTTVNTLTYDQLFMYNRFSGIDRINDANQIAYGLTSRFIDYETGTEKVKAAIGQILYFKERKVTLCNNPNDPLCQPAITDFPSNPDNKRSLSPLSALLRYSVNPDWSATADSIWNPQTKTLDNQSVGIHFQPPATQKIINLGYNYVRNGDPLPTDQPDSGASNLSSTDLSFNWPILRDWSVMGRWTQNWNHHHFQNLLYGLQYDSCCWAIRFVAGRAFTGLNPSNTFQYNTQFYIQFALKGLGTIPIHGGDPSQLLNANISGIQNNFGRDF